MINMASVPSGDREAAAAALSLHERGAIARMVLSTSGIALIGMFAAVGGEGFGALVAFLLPIGLLVATYIIAVTAWRFGALPGAEAARATPFAIGAALIAGLAPVAQRLSGYTTSSERAELARIVIPIELGLGAVAICAMLMALGAVGDAIGVHGAKQRATTCAVVQVLASAAFALSMLGKERHMTMWTLLGLVLGMVALLLYVRMLRSVGERLTAPPDELQRMSMPF
jgi:hypothetical protein